MVTWKKNYKYVKKASKAKTVDLLSLQNLHPDRMEIVAKEAKEWHLQYDRISLLKVWDDWFVYGLEVVGREMKKYASEFAKIYFVQDLGKCRKVWWFQK